MVRTVLKIIEALVVLILLLLVPMAVSSSVKKQNNKLDRSISAEAATIENFNSSNIAGYEVEPICCFSPLLKYKSYALYTITVLFIISVITFIKFKVSKDIREQRL